MCLSTQCVQPFGTLALGAACLPDPELCSRLSGITPAPEALGGGRKTELGFRSGLFAHCLPSPAVTTGRSPPKPQFAFLYNEVKLNMPRVAAFRASEGWSLCGWPVLHVHSLGRGSVGPRGYAERGFFLASWQCGAACSACTAVSGKRSAPASVTWATGEPSAPVSPDPRSPKAGPLPGPFIGVLDPAQTCSWLPIVHISSQVHVQ